MRRLKKLSPALAIILVLFVFYGTLACIDAVRLKDKIGEKPIITVREERENNTVKYEGLGYSVIYHFGEITDEGVAVDGCGAEFRLFDKFLLWAWIE